MNEERIDVVVTVLRAVGDCPVEEYSVAVSPKCTVDKIHHMLFAEVDWLYDKKDEYLLALPDGAPLSVYFHRIGEVASIMAIHRAGQKARLLLLPNNNPQQPKVHTPPVIPRLSLSGGGVGPSALSLSPRGTSVTTALSPRSMALVGSPRRHSFYPSSMFSLTEAEQSDIGAAKEAEIVRGAPHSDRRARDSEGDGEQQTISALATRSSSGVKARGSGLKRSNTKEEIVAVAASATMKAKEAQEENERLRRRMGELEQLAKRREQELEERQRAWTKEKEELLLALEAAKQQQQLQQLQSADSGVSEREERTKEKEERKEKSEKRKSDKRKASKGNSHDGIEEILSTEEGSSTPTKKKSKHKIKKASRSLKISEVKGMISPIKHRKGSKTWDERGDKQAVGAVHHNRDAANADISGESAADNKPEPRPKRRSKKSESKERVETASAEPVVDKAGGAGQSPMTAVSPSVGAKEATASADNTDVGAGTAQQQSLKDESLARSGSGSSEDMGQMDDDNKTRTYDRQRQGSFIIVEEEDVRIDEDLLDSGSDTGSGVKFRKASGLAAIGEEGEQSGDLSEGKIDEDEVEGNYHSEAEGSDGGGMGRRRQESIEFGSRGEDKPITLVKTGGDADDDDEEEHVLSDEDSGREEWEGGNRGARRALRFTKTDTTWSEMRRRKEKKKWLQEKKERTRTSRWEELIKEQQETLKALQFSSCEFGAIASSSEFAFSFPGSSTSDLSASTEAAYTPIAPSSTAGGAGEAPKPETSVAPAHTEKPNEEAATTTTASAAEPGGVQAYKTHQIRRLWFRRKNTLPRSLEELSAEYAANKKELDERSRQWLEKRREKGEAPETDEREREREKQERKSLRLRLFGAPAVDAGEDSGDEDTNSGNDKKGTRQMRALSVLIKKHDGDGDDGDDKEKKRSESTRKSRKHSTSGSATSSPTTRKSGSMIASLTPAKDKIRDTTGGPPDQDVLKSASMGERISPMIARKKAKDREKSDAQPKKHQRRNTALASSSPPDSTHSYLSDNDSSTSSQHNGSHISTASTNNSGDLAIVPDK